jgi:hypothetical protein
LEIPDEGPEGGQGDEVKESKRTKRILMKHLLNTLYVTTPGAFLCREGETVIVRVEQETKLQVPVAAARQLFPTLAGMNEY